MHWLWKVILQNIIFMKNPVFYITLLLGSYRSNFLSRKSLTASQNEAKEKWRGGTATREQMPPPPPIWPGLMLPLPPSLSPPLQNPAAAAMPASDWTISFPPPPHGWIYVIFSVLGQKRGWPPFRGSKVLQLNSDSFCDHVRIWTEVIGHLWAEIGFWFFPEKRWKYSRPRTFGQDANILAGRAGTTAGTVRQRRRPYKMGGLRADPHLRTAWRRDNITWPRALQPDLEGVRSWRFCRAQIGRVWAHTSFVRREDFNGRLVAIAYYEARTFLLWRIYFIYAQIF